jgi:YihY family inner membrane protein
VAVVKRYSDDRGGQLGALMTFYGFLSVFPLILLLVTVAGFLVPDSVLKKALVDSALSQFPIIGDQIAANIHAVAKGNTFAVVASTMGLLWGCFGITSSMQFASSRIWGLERHEEPKFLRRMLTGVELLLVLALIIVLSSVAATLSTIGARYFGNHSALSRVLVLLIAAVSNLVGYALALWMLAPESYSMRQLVPGAVSGAIAWTAVQALSGYLIGHRLAHTSQIYGFFAVVLGLIFWISLGVQIFLLSSELNVVLLRRQWPRYLFSDASATSSS